MRIGKHFNFLFVIIMTLTMVLGFGWMNRTQATTLKVEHDEPVSSITHKILLNMAKEVEKTTDGKLTLEIHPACSLSGGNIKTMITNTQMGSVDISYIATSIYAPMIDNRLGVIHLPFLFKDIHQLEAVARKGDTVNKLYVDQKQKNLVVLDAWSRNLRQFVNKKHPVKSPEDMKGLTFRVPENQLWMDAVEALGANVVSMPFSEVPVALQTGAVNGAERPTEFLISEEWWTMAKYVTMANYTGDVIMVAANKNKWASVPDDLKAALTNAIMNAGNEKLSKEVAFQDKAVQTLREKGMEVVVIDQKASQAFRDKMGPVWNKHSANIGKEIVDAVIAEVKVLK